MGKKKHKKRDRHEGSTPLPAPLAGIAATLARHADSPAGRQLLANALTMAAATASAALTRTDTAAAPAEAPPPQPDAPVPPAPPTPPEGITRTPDPHEIGVALGKAAEQVLGAFFRKKPG